MVREQLLITLLVYTAEIYLFSSKCKGSEIHRHRHPLLALDPQLHTVVRARPAGKLVKGTPLPVRRLLPRHLHHPQELGQTHISLGL